MFQSYQGVWVLLDDLVGDAVIGLQFQPSLSLRDLPQPAFRATSAFLLQAFAQSCVMVGLVSNSFPRMKTRFTCGGGGHSQIADAHIDPNDFAEVFAGRFGPVNSQGHE